MNETVGVVVPYFQVERGLLARAVRSILAQESPVRLDLVVVDDGSPRPAREELAGVPVPPGATLRVIHQRNAGPGAARNRALAALRPDTRFVAFLDSDDTWRPDHLPRALRNLRDDADFYFSDMKRPGDPVSFFHTMSKLGEWPRGETHRPHETEPDGRVLTGGFEEMVLRGLVTTQTVVYRFDRLPDLRFPREFFRYGEDQTFWLAAGRRARRIVYSTRLGAHYGQGVSIFSGASWDMPEAVLTARHEIRFRKHVRERVPLPAAARRLLAAKLRAARRGLSGKLVYHLRRGRCRLVVPALFEDPLLLRLVARDCLLRLLRGRPPDSAAGAGAGVIPRRGRAPSGA